MLDTKHMTDQQQPQTGSIVLHIALLMPVGRRPCCEKIRPFDHPEHRLQRDIAYRGYPAKKALPAMLTHGRYRVEPFRQDTLDIWHSCDPGSRVKSFWYVLNIHSLWRGLLFTPIKTSLTFDTLINTKFTIIAGTPVSTWFTAWHLHLGR